MADNKYNSKPGQTLTDIANAEYKKMITKNIYQPKDPESNYSVNHKNATSDGDDKGKGNAIYLGVYGEDIGTRTDIHGNGEANTGRVNNLKTNLYGKNNEYSSGNIDSDGGYEPQM